MSVNYYDPTDVNIEELVKRVRVGQKTEELIRTPTGLSIVERATQDYKQGLEALQEMAMQQWAGSSDWLDAILNDGENAESIARYRDAGET